MTPIQQLMLGVGAKKKTYMDDVFSTYLYTGTGSAKTINNGIDLSGEGGLVWTKNRTNSWNNNLIDTVRGKTKRLKSDHSAAEWAYNDLITAFNSNGYAIGADTSTNEVNQSTANFTSWTFRKAKGFFDVVTYTGDGASAKTISHSLGSIPGLIMIKCTSNANTDWIVWHRDFGATDFLKLNESSAKATDDEKFGGSSSVLPTSTTFTIGDSNDVNGSSRSYLAYVFAGGESTAATARSVDFDGNDYLSLAGSPTTWDLGQTFTVEMWVDLDSLNGTGFNVIINQANGWYVSANSSGRFQFYDPSCDVLTETTEVAKATGSWAHIAMVANNGTGQWYINGTANGPAVTGVNVSNGSSSNLNCVIGSWVNGTSYPINGRVSNLRIVKGTAVYTSSFRPPTKPLTNITNTLLLCCQTSTVTDAAVIPSGSITAGGDPTSSNLTPFDDPAGLAFGDSQEGVIKCGSYVGNGSATGPEINLGWEPQLLMVKNATSASTEWVMLDSMRGIIDGANEYELRANANNAESNSQGNRMSLTPTGFKIKDTASYFNSSGDTYIFLALRRPDGYVGKPPELGTGVFAMDTGSGSATIPTYDSGFPVDFSFQRTPGGTLDWWTYARLIQGKFLNTNNNDAQGSDAGGSFDSNVGYSQGSGRNSNYQAWMWKRHAGFDVVAEKGGQKKRIPHSLNKIPEMYWVKNRDAAENWTVYHKGLNGGTNPENRYMVLNSDGGQSGSDTSAWDSFVPTSTHISFGTMDTTGGNSSHNYLVMLFASVDKISKVGYYDGSASSQTISTGFAPRFVLIKEYYSTQARAWLMLDTTRGWASGNDKGIFLNSSNAQFDYDYADPTSTGFTLAGGNALSNDPNNKYIYYAHA